VTSRPPDGPLVYNVAGLLADGLGAWRDHAVEGLTIALPDGLILAAPIEGHVRLTRETRGILATARLSGALALECAACLRPVVVPLDLRLDEEFLPALDLATGRPVVDPDDPDALYLSDHHELDLEPSVRDAVALAEPIAARCRPDCPGLCVGCGLPLDEGVHEHPVDDVDPRLAGLAAFRPDGE
jgi:uncharacterized protein